MDYFISCVDLGDFDVRSKDGSLALTTGVSLFFRGSEGGEEEIAADKLHELVTGGLGFSGATSCRITFCPLIEGIPMHPEYLGPDGGGFVQVLAHLVEDLDAWQQLGLRLGPTARVYSHDESSVSFNYRIEHTNLELPGPVSADSTTPELENVRCHLDFSVQVPGFPIHGQGCDSRRRAPKKGRARQRRGSDRNSAHQDGSHHGARMIIFFTRSITHGLTARREESVTQDPVPGIVATLSREKTTSVVVKREESPADVSDPGLSIQKNQYLTAGRGIPLISDHPELETIVRAALNHMLLGSRPRGTHISEGFSGKALTRIAPAVFDTDRLRGVAARIPLIGGPASAISYFAAKSKSPSLRKKTQALTLIDENPSSGMPVSMQLAEARLCKLVHTDSKPISPKSSQSSGGGDVVPSSLDYSTSNLGPFSGADIGEEMLLPDDWPQSQMSLLSGDGVSSGINQDLMPQQDATGNYTAGWAHYPTKADSPHSYIQAGDVTAQVDMLGMMQTHHHGIPRYFEEYHGRLLLKQEGASGMGRDIDPSSIV